MLDLVEGREQATCVQRAGSGQRTSYPSAESQFRAESKLTAKAK